jgi:hypothetical protein
MPEFDKLAFEQLMGEAVHLHNERKYNDALALSTQAYEIAPENSYEKGRAARDNSARYDRLGDEEASERWATEAYAIHDGLLQETLQQIGGLTAGSPRQEVIRRAQLTREAYRERSVSAMYVGVNGLRRSIRDLRARGQHESANDAVNYLRTTWSDLKDAKTLAPKHIDGQIDQYEVNAARRVSMAESLFGNHKTGLAVGIRAVKLAFWSESPRLDTANPNMTNKQRLRSKAKAFLGGVAAVGVGILSTRRTDRGMRLAATLADKTL